MRTHPRNDWPHLTRNGHSAIYGVKVNSPEKSERIDLGLAILCATQPGEPLTCAEIAAYCGCCPERINQIEHRALERVRDLLSLLEQPPEHVTANEAAWIINCRPHEVPILVETGLLKPLAPPRPNGITHFAAPELLELVKDETWRARVTNAVNHHRHKWTGVQESVLQMVWFVLMVPQLFP